MEFHDPALLKQVMDGLRLTEGAVYLDATVGGAGHASAAARLIGKSGTLISLDRDPEAIAAAKMRLQDASCSKVFVRTGFDDLDAVLTAHGFQNVDAALFDLGVSLHQLEDVRRGFTFRDPLARLDMRMDPDDPGPTAADILNSCTEIELTKWLRDYSDEVWAARIAKFVVQRRAVAQFETAGQLVDTVLAAVPAAARPRDIHPATRVFQSLRIVVNREFERLEAALKSIVGRISPAGRVAVIAYHSGEDRIVKHTFSAMSGRCVCARNEPVCRCGADTPRIRLITRKPIVPDPEEIARNPRSRSAKLRIAERI